MPATPPEDGKFKKGQSGNPKGRPKGSRNRDTLLRKWLETKTSIKNPVSGKVEKITVEDEVVLALIKEARKGNVTAIREIQDTMYGKVADKLESDNNHKVIFEWNDDGDE